MRRQNAFQMSMSIAIYLNGYIAVYIWKAFCLRINVNPLTDERRYWDYASNITTIIVCINVLSSIITIIEYTVSIAMVVG